MCHYTIERCSQCGEYLEVQPQICEKNSQSRRGFCDKNKTNDGWLDASGRNEVICPTGVPFPFIEFHYSDGHFHSISALHKVQELLAICSTCSPNGDLTPRAEDLGGFLFHLIFDDYETWNVGRRICLGRYVVDYCKHKECRSTGCKPCQEMGMCGHHGSRNTFKFHEENKSTMDPLLMRHTYFLDNADICPRPIRVIKLGYPSPQPTSQSTMHCGPSLATVPVNVFSELAQNPTTHTDLAQSGTLPNLTTPTPRVPHSQQLTITPGTSDGMYYESQEASVVGYTQLPSPPDSNNEDFDYTQNAGQAPTDAISTLMGISPPGFKLHTPLSSATSSTNDTPARSIAVTGTSFGETAGYFTNSPATFTQVTQMPHPLAIEDQANFSAGALDATQHNSLGDSGGLELGWTIANDIEVLDESSTMAAGQEQGRWQELATENINKNGQELYPDPSLPAEHESVCSDAPLLVF